MNIFLIVFAVLILLVFFILFILYSETKVEIKYEKEKLQLIIRNGILKLKFSPKRRVNKETDSGESKVEGKIAKIKKGYMDSKDIINIFLKAMRYRIKVEKLKIHLAYGADNAAKTGILYGVIWGMVVGAYTTLKMFFGIDFPDVKIEPDFKNSKFEFSFNGILRIRIVHIISVLIKILKYKHLKNKKEGGKINA